MNDNLKSRLENWKFQSAMKYIEGEDDVTREVVSALANTFGDCGWTGGSMGTIIEAALDSILPEPVTDEERANGPRSKG